ASAGHSAPGHGGHDGETTTSSSSQGGGKVGSSSSTTRSSSVQEQSLTPIVIFLEQVENVPFAGFLSNYNAAAVLDQYQKYGGFEGVDSAVDHGSSSSRRRPPNAPVLCNLCTPDGRREQIGGSMPSTGMPRATSSVDSSTSVRMRLVNKETGSA
ncbi:unnamed protein product, partial [Amoebophrya sp. A25]